MYDARAVANFILITTDSKSANMTNLKINKMIFFVHGWYLARRNKPLIRNHFEAWPLGPVVRVVFDSFKKYNRDFITEPATYFDYSLGKEKVLELNNLSKSDEILIKNIINYYAKYTASELVSLTHANNTPWHEIFHADDENKGLTNRIPNEIIHRYFNLMIEAQKTH